MDIRTYLLAYLLTYLFRFISWNLTLVFRQSLVVVVFVSAAVQLSYCSIFTAVYETAVFLSRHCTEME